MAGADELKEEIESRWRDLGEFIREQRNLGQLSLLLRGHFLVDAQSVTKMKGLPFTAGEIERAILAELEKDP